MDIPEITKERIKQYLSENKRFDGRKPLDFREIVIETGISKNAEGSARVKLGNTEVIAGVKIDVATPYTDHEDEGTLVTTAELLPMSSSTFEAGPPGIESVETARIIDRGIRESGFIDFKKLCIKEGEKVYSIMLDIYSINYDGNLIDAGNIASVVALMTAKIPKYDEEKGKIVYGELTEKQVPVTEKIPINITFHKLGNNIIVDPSFEEEESSEARVSLALTRNKKEIMINAAQKGGMEIFTKDELFSIIDAAEEKYSKIEKEIENAVKKSK